MTKEEIKAEIAKHSWWHRIEVAPGIITPGVCSHGNKRDFETRWGLDESYKGKSVLDIGAWDGLFSFEVEKRGASKVTAMDIYQYAQHSSAPTDGAWTQGKPFELAKTILNSKVAFHNLNVMDLPNSKIPEHDVVLFYGVFYHLEEPWKGLKNAASKAREEIIVETTIAKGNGVSMEFRPGYAGDPTNLFYPTSACVIEMLKTLGFSEVEEIFNMSERATFKAKR